MIPSLRHRRREPEWMDAPDVDPQMLDRSLRFIRRVNTLLGYRRVMLWHLERFSLLWKPGETIRIIDLATGSADIPLAISTWSRRRGFDVRIVGVDLHETTARAAGELSRHDERVTIVRADVLDLPFADNSFDYALTAMFLHHLPEEQVVAVLRNMQRVAKRGVIISDLLRHYRAYAWITLLTLFSIRMIRHDARVSVAQAFTRAEIEKLRDEAGIGFARYFRHFGHRFVLAGEKNCL